MTIKRPKLLIIFAKRGTDTSTRFGGFVTRIKKQGGFDYADVDYVALEDLRFHILNEKVANVYDPTTNVHLKNYDFVYFKSWQSLPTLAASAALYLEAMGIAYADHQARHEFRTKTANQMAMWAKHIAVPATAWGSLPVLLQYVQEATTEFPLIIKAAYSEKGKDNFLAKNRQEAVSILEKTNQDIDMMIQEFIPNDGDYRIGVYGHQARWALYRRSGGASHLNNTSAGGTAVQIDIDEVNDEIKRIAEAAAAACDLAISGVDVVQDKNTGQLYIFEANQGSQIVTGAFRDTNMAAFDAGMKAMVMRRQANITPQQKTIIGRRVMVSIEGAVSMLAKVDTGAYRSAVDATDISVQTDEAGREYLAYTVQSRYGDNTPHRIKTYDYGRTEVRSSLGDIEMRYVVPLSLTISGQQYHTQVTLANRASQKCQMLIGRTLLAGNFLVNVEYSSEDKEAA